MSLTTKDLNERIAVLEVRIDELSKDLVTVYKDIRDHMEEESKDREVFLSQLSEINNTLSRYRGIMGGFTLAFTSIATIIGLAWNYLGSKL